MNDAERIRATGCKVVQVNTGTGCHLEADMVARGVGELQPPQNSVVMIENVGNLVCPASFDLGQHLNVTLLSTPEGHDKPAKYPVMFRTADAVVLSKADLLPVLDDFSPQRAETCLRNLANAAPLIRVSAKSGEGLQDWLKWVRKTVREQRQSMPKAPSPQEHHHHDPGPLHKHRHP